MKKLVFDIGLNNGDDAAYYLHLGYRVVGVEADPLLAAHCSQRFEREIRSGQMTVVNAGILKRPGEFTFYRSVQDDGLSTFEPNRAAEYLEWEELKVSCITAQWLIEDYGQPFFIKVDIEEADFQVLETLTPAIAPAYISLELNLIDPFIDRLVQLGYNAFKFVDGGTFHHTPPIFSHQIGWRLLRKLGKAIPVLHDTMCKLPERLRPKQDWSSPGKYSPDGYNFTSHSSGPFGERASGSWMTARDAERWLKRLVSDFLKAGSPWSFWWDIHARHSLAPKMDIAA
jgi:FkbM family methyltransferase